MLLKCFWGDNYTSASYHKVFLIFGYIQKFKYPVSDFSLPFLIVAYAKGLAKIFTCKRCFWHSICTIFVTYQFWKMTLAMSIEVWAIMCFIFMGKCFSASYFTMVDTDCTVLFGSRTVICKNEILKFSFDSGPIMSLLKQSLSFSKVRKIWLF